MKKQHHYLKASEIVQYLKQNKWNAKKFAELFGSPKKKATMHLVFSGKQWTTDDITAWNKAIKAHKAWLKKTADTVGRDGSQIIPKKLASKKQRTYISRHETDKSSTTQV